MTVKKTALHALISGILASIACMIYNSIYTKAFEVNFTSVLNTSGIFGSCIFSCVLMGVVYYFAYRWKGQKLIPWVNIMIAVLSFASIVGPIGMSLPMNIESPELFPGLAIPMHFFPAFAFFTITPFFKQD
jgi:hypothetical protein